MKMVPIFVVWMLAAGPLAAATVDELHWMAGIWLGTANGVESEEHWSAPSGGLLIGMHRDVREGRAVGFEFFRIQAQDGVITYLSQPGGRPAVPFKMKEMGAQRIVFENLGHDFPQRIIYWQTQPGELRARVEGAVDGKLESDEWIWTQAPKAP